MSRVGEAGLESAPQRSASPHEDTTKTEASASAAQAGNFSTATTKGSRRVQGWHSAVSGGAPFNVAGTNHSTLDSLALGSSAPIGDIAIQSSVQDSENVLLDHHRSPCAQNFLHGAAGDEAVDFRQSMTDFLTMLYGEKTVSGAARSEGNDSASNTKGKTTSAGESGIPDAPLPVKRVSLPFMNSSRGASSSRKGPVVRGLTANSGHHTQGDRIDTLVNSLMRAYSRRSASARSDFHSTSVPDDDHPVLYSSPRQCNFWRVSASPRLGPGKAGATFNANDDDEVSVFVSQAIDNIFGPAAIRGQRAASNLSILSSLGLDKNLFDLMSFQAQSNLQNAMAGEEDSDSVLQPVYVGEQAVFRSLGTPPNKDVSISHSMRGMIPPALHGPENYDCLDTTQTPLHAGIRGRQRFSGNSGFLRQLTRDSVLSPDGDGGIVDAGTEPQGGRDMKGDAKARIMGRCMSLDSKSLRATGGEDFEDDSWGDGPAGILAVKGRSSGSSAALSSSHGHLPGSKPRAKGSTQQALGALQDEEKLKRDIMIAVERQLCGYITSLEVEERSRTSGGSVGRNGVS
ncbi:hypothetical protein JKF63_03787 [Porcisia hertigi]|uniref:Uncharacterized protein n=1 Tax=Porcisia hertigi TaxID=2761500 RepID=A0A836IC22_9TRYP|nr:hypothetical protein JKF63_03787 [Porcisia hertigi]